MEDSRFSSSLRDPRFKRIPMKEQKTKIDDRFNAMFKDKSFKLKYVMDKRGRPMSHSTSEDLKKFYEISSSESDDDNSKKKTKNLTKIDKNSKNYQIKPLKTPKLKNGKQLDKKQSSSAVQKFSADRESNQGQADEKEQDKDMLSSDELIIDESKTSTDSDSNQASKNKKEKSIKPCKLQTKQCSTLEESEDEQSEDEQSNGFGSDDDLRKDDFEDESGSTSSTSEDSDIDCDDKLKLAERHRESESSETDEESDDAQNEKFDHKWEELDADAPLTSEATNRIAVCNMDWDRLRSDDIFAVFNSFKPASGVIRSVKVYPSEFGLKRMEEEKLRGPTELVEKTLNSDEEDDGNEDKEGSRYHREKLRQYQINRLKYYYAVVECDSAKTADSLYEQLNGMEYESSAVSMDLRFIPDDTTFDQEPANVAFCQPDASEYKPRLFITSALQQVKVNLTWDETDPKRRDAIQKAFTASESIDKDIKNYLASSSSGSENEDEIDSIQAENGKDSSKIKMKDQIASYRSLLLSLEEKEKKEEDEYEMEITWEPGLKEKTEEIVHEKLEKDTLTPFEETLKKKKEGRKLKKKERKIHKNDNEDENSEHSCSSSDENVDEDVIHNSKADKFHSKHNSLPEDKNKWDELSLMMSDPTKVKSSFEDISKKKKKKKQKEIIEDDFKVNVNDQRFSAIYTSHLFNIDPSDPHYKETEAMKAIMQEKQKKRKIESTTTDSVNESVKKCSKISDDALNLVNSVKRKTNLKQKRRL